MTGRMETSINEVTPAALTVPGAVRYSGTYIYLHREQLEWLKAGRRTLIARDSLDELLSTHPRVNRRR
jgi:hypothetical protein